jgi:serine/threonine protein kinase
MNANNWDSQQCLCINPGCDTFKQLREYTGEPCQSCHADLLLNNRYLVTQLIHENGNLNSRVFEAIDTTLDNQLVIVKIIYFDEYVDDSSRGRAIDGFKREVGALSDLSDNNITGIPRVERESDFLLELPSQNRNRQALAFAMEKVEGQDLREWMESRDYQLPNEEQAIDWLRQLVNTLGKLHRNGYYHRDVKPSNIMLKPDGNLVLIDLGAVCDVTHNALEGREGQQLTRLGTAFYAAPEQLQEGTVNNTTDFYALGRTFIHLLIGREPINNWHSSVQNQISSKLADLLDKLTQINPRERYHSAEEIKRQLEQIERELEKKRTDSKRKEKFQQTINNIWQSLLNPRNIVTVFGIGMVVLVSYLFLRVRTPNTVPTPIPTSTPLNDDCKTRDSFSPLAEAATEAYKDAYTKADSSSIIKKFNPNQVLFQQESCTIQVEVKPGNAGDEDVQKFKTELTRILNNPDNYEPEFRDKFKVYFRVEGKAQWETLKPS